MIITSNVHTHIDRLKETFRSITATSCPHTFNFHLHTQYSDGQLLPHQVIEQALQLGLVGLAITDHHSIEGYWHALDHIQSQPKMVSQPELWTGIEITSTLLDTQVHILGYGFDPHHSALQPYQLGSAPTGHIAQADRVIAALHQAGGLAILAHPARYRRSAQELVIAATQAGIDGIETFYCYRNTDPWEPSPPETEALRQLASQHNLLQTCGTDTHGVDICRRR